MIGGNYTEFIDLLTYGEELVFIYKEKKYFLQGWWNDDKTQATMVLTVVDDSDFNGYHWECHQDHMRKCAEAFLSEPLWGGKNFNQIQEDVIWTDW
ncbi:MAG: hypothetical protein IJ120_01365 [Solobacterium sp.]|nr:hypothetical protein [Solobacterium sp.]